MQFVPGRIAALDRVLAERGQQVLGVPGGDPGFRQTVAQQDAAGRAAIGLAEQHGLHPVKARNLVGGVQRRAVGNVVGVTGKGVERVDMRAQRLADQGGADREILVAPVLAGPFLDGLPHNRLSFGAHAPAPP